MSTWFSTSGKQQQGSRPTSRSSSRARTFRPFSRDDSALIAFPYHKAVAAQPPIPVPARSGQRRPSGPARAFSTFSSGTVVVAPPPREQHPAFRTHSPVGHDWKRDSAVGSASSSASSTVSPLPYPSGSSSDRMMDLDSDGCTTPPSSPRERFPVLAGPAEAAEADREPARRHRAAEGLAVEEPAAYEQQREREQDQDHDQNHAQAQTLDWEQAGQIQGVGQTLGCLRSNAVRRVRDMSISGRSVVSPPPRAPSLDATHQPEIGATISESPAPFPDHRTATQDHCTEQPATVPSLSDVPAGSAPSRPSSSSTESLLAQRPASPVAGLDFFTLSVCIPTDGLVEDDFISRLTFSKRGSILLGGRRAIRPDSLSIPAASSFLSDHVAMPALAEAPLFEAPSVAALSVEAPAVEVPSVEAPAVEAPFAVARAMEAPCLEVPFFEASNVEASSVEVPLITPTPAMEATTMSAATTTLHVQIEIESQKVRSLYDSSTFSDQSSDQLGDLHVLAQEESPLVGTENDPLSGPASGTSTAPLPSIDASPPRPVTLARRNPELAGGLEDWDNVSTADVDRYGFISPPRPATGLKSVHTTARRKRNVLVRRDLSGWTPGSKVVAQSLHTQNSDMSTMSHRSSRSAFRLAGNMLPHNRDRRWMDEASEMLTSTPTLGNIMEDRQVDFISDTLKRKEWTRTEKWRRMAKVVKDGTDGQGMHFEFDTRNPKLVERTWKGIPDRWRSAAWYSFLQTSARDQGMWTSEVQLMADFHRLQNQSSPDDVQIDLDVPRTINRHIMFRRRYRGGQRLLFRVLHALSLYFPHIGYVQGMASLAATLLCYYEEERCFVMLVRMWQLRGLETLYQPGFDALLALLKDLETKWLGGQGVAKKLAELNIDATAYGARWYLTLFSLSIPFPAQLRVWDVFLLLGGSGPGTLSPHPSHGLGAGAAGASSASTSASSSGTSAGATDSEAIPAIAGSGADTGPGPAQTGPLDRHDGALDVLHATSAALMHALRDVMLDSDFENAMKALTTWIPVKDEDLLMKVARAEWRLHRGRKM